MGYSLASAIRAVIFTVLFLSAGTPVLAHAVLIDTTPAQNALLEAPPETIDLRFNEPVSLLAVSLVTPLAETIQLPTDASGETVSIAMPETLAQGTHVLSWRVVSLDGHPVGGTSIFSIGTVAGAAPVGASTDQTVTALLWASKVVLYASIFFGVGGAVFMVGVARCPAAALGIARSLTGAGLVAAPVSVGLQGIDALALGAGGMITPAAWAVGMATTYGWTALVLMLALASAGASLELRSHHARQVLGIAAWILAPLALAFSGHASAADPQWLMRPAVFFHVAGILFWSGALVPLAVMIRASGSESSAALARFSERIPFAVAAILISGATLATVQMGIDPSRWTAPYGLVLAAKLVVLIILFGLAVFNRFGLTAPSLAGQHRARQKLRSVILVEIVLIAMIFGLVATWRFTPPPRTLGLTTTTPINFHIQTADLMADVTIAPGTAGPNTFAIYLANGELGAVEPLDVSLAVSSPALGIEKTRFDARPGADGTWHVEDVTLPLAGEWHVDVDVRLTRFELVTLTEKFVVP